MTDILVAKNRGITITTFYRIRLSRGWKAAQGNASVFEEVASPETGKKFDATNGSRNQKIWHIMRGHFRITKEGSVQKIGICLLSDSYEAVFSNTRANRNVNENDQFDKTILIFEKPTLLQVLLIKEVNRSYIKQIKDYDI